MRTLLLAVVLFAAMASAWSPFNQGHMRALGKHQANKAKEAELHRALHEKLSKQSNDFKKLPPIEQKQVIQALHYLLVARLTPEVKNGKMISMNISATGLPCWICEKAVGWLVDHANDWACDAGFDAIATLACQAAGLGPEDPWSDICTAAIIAGCNIILEAIEDHVHSTSKICGLLHLC